MPFLDELINPGSPVGQLIDPNNPDSQGALLQIGLSMLQPQQAGTSFAQNAFGSVGNGLNYLQQLESARNTAGLEQQRADTAQLVGESEAFLKTEQGSNVSRRSDQIDVQNASQQYVNETLRNKSQVVLSAARSKLGEEKVKANSKLMSDLLDVFEARITSTSDAEFDTEQFASIFNILSDTREGTFDQRRLLYKDGQWILDASAFDSIDPETGEPIKNYMVLPEDYAKVLSSNTDQIKAAEEQRVQEDLARSTQDISAESGIIPTDFSKEGTNITQGVDTGIQAPTAVQQSAAELFKTKAAENIRDKEFAEKRKISTGIDKLDFKKPVSEVRAKILKTFKGSSFNKLETWQKRVWLKKYGRFITAKDRKTIEESIGQE